MSVVIQFPDLRASTEEAAPVATSGNVGGDCPFCGKSDGYVNVRSNHFGVCTQHKVYWEIGANLFSCWKEETEADWQRSADMLGRFRRVESIESEPESANVDIGVLDYDDTVPF